MNWTELIVHTEITYDWLTSSSLIGWYETLVKNKTMLLFVLTNTVSTTNEVSFISVSDYLNKISLLFSSTVYLCKWVVMLTWLSKHKMKFGCKVPFWLKTFLFLKIKGACDKIYLHRCIGTCVCPKICMHKIFLFYSITYKRIFDFYRDIITVVAIDQFHFKISPNNNFYSHK